MNKLILVCCIALLTTQLAYAENKPITGIQLEKSDFKKRSLPRNESMDFIVEDQGYDDNKALVFSADINGDGKPDFIIESDYKICGTGGCIYMLVDGKTFEKKGEFTGSHLIISDTKVNGHAELMMLRYSDKDQADLEMYQYNKKEYVLKKTIPLKGQALTNQLKQLRRAKSVK